MPSIKHTTTLSQSASLPNIDGGNLRSLSSSPYITSSATTNISAPVLLINPAAGHLAIADAADHRLNMLRTLTGILACSKSDAPGESDQADICLVLGTLIDEAASLYSTAYDLAVAAGKKGVADAGAPE